MHSLINKGRLFEWKVIVGTNEAKNTVLPFYLFPRNGAFGKGGGAGDLSCPLFLIVKILFGGWREAEGEAVCYTISQ